MDEEKEGINFHSFRNKKILVDVGSVLLLIFITIGAYVTYRGVFYIGDDNDLQEEINKVNYMESLDDRLVYPDEEFYSDLDSNEFGGSNYNETQSNISVSGRVIAPPQYKVETTGVNTVKTEVKSSSVQNKSGHTLSSAEEKEERVSAFDDANYQFSSADDKLRQLSE